MQCMKNFPSRKRFIIPFPLAFEKISGTKSAVPVGVSGVFAANSNRRANHRCQTLKPRALALFVGREQNR